MLAIFSFIYHHIVFLLYLISIYIYYLNCTLKGNCLCLDTAWSRCYWKFPSWTRLLNKVWQAQGSELYEVDLLNLNGESNKCILTLNICSIPQVNIDITSKYGPILAICLPANYGPITKKSPRHVTFFVLGCCVNELTVNSVSLFSE